ncbi:MAG: AAA family ATPase [Alphaproteobacteria bacterium]|nr:AAA family ATPase [Alphaproteobacteria bacterium]
MSDEENITPQNNFFLMGQEDAERTVLEAYKNNKLHNSWLISGEKGIGKTTFAYKFARFLLSEKKGTESLNTSPDSLSNKLITSASHPDLKFVERGYIETDRKKIIKAIRSGEPMSEAELQNLKKSAVIRVDDVREINEFMAKKSSQDGWRIVIVDSIDDMNTAAANALLKILEEPPAKSIIMLISHNVGKLLPTIKSRCSKLELKPLADNIVVSLLRRYRPQLEEKKIAGIAKMSSGSIGKALNYADCGALQVYDGLQKIVYSGKNFKLDNLLEWVNNVLSDNDTYALAQELILKFCSDNIAGCRDVEEMARVWENAVRVFRQCDSLNMDRKHVLINIVAELCKIN